ncbi:hypothetical protein [Asanoa siamensis]|uniref:Thioredoxin domain-containing protein n=1 Tax=Asanoa siamensis TaxID=926357 RepID=A0ABQ4D2Y9_9ACTN|nr:hypothetical protein [Asanoa siamensis]GIF77894.1 hypothetical protein Asi02nite_74120 [Asanoa siamensis]
MGTPHDGDSEPFDELPELPPDVRVPDDAAELAEEAAQVRRELREERVGGSRSSARVFPDGGFRGSVPPDGAPAATEPASLRIPLLIMTAALLAAVVSLFAAAWPDERRGAAPAAGASAPATTGTAFRNLPDLALLDEQGRTVPLGPLLPAVLILAGDCPCAAEIVAAAPAGVTVVAVDAVRTGAPPPSTATLPGPANATVRRLRDPAGDLVDFFTGDAAATTPTATPVALVDRSGDVAKVVYSDTPTSAYAADLATLATR